MSMTAATKPELLDVIRRERGRWEKLVGEVGVARMTESGATGDWSFKDVVAHLTAWRDVEIARLEAASCGGSPAPPPWPKNDDIDQINAWIDAQNRERSLGDILRESNASFARLEAAVRAIPEPDLFAPGRFPWMGGKSIGPAVVHDALAHFAEEHEAALRAWLARSS